MIVVLANGCFDILHWGHLQHLKAARKLGDMLVVSLTDDAHVNKGPGRPIFKVAQRKEMLLSLRCVNRVIITPAGGPAHIIRTLRPNIYVKGKEYEGRLPEQALVESLGGCVIFTDEPVYSSTALVSSL